MKVQLKHWQDVLNALFGLWLVAAPWVLGFDAGNVATSNSVVAGVLLMAAALGAVFVPKAWEEWVEIALGAWIAASPWVLGYATLQSATTNAFLTGLVVFSLSLWVLGTDKDFGFGFTDRTA